MPLRIERRCNQRCAFCNADPESPDERFVTDFEEIGREIDAMPRGSQLVLSGGEPTLRRDVADIVRRAHDRGLETVLQTNAIRIDRTLARALSLAGLDEAFVSLHAPDAATSDAITGAPGTFARTLAGIDELRRAGVIVSLNFVCHGANHHRLREFVAFAATRFEREVKLSLSVMSSAFPGWLQPGLPVRYADIMPHLAAALDEGLRRGVLCTVPRICGVPECFVPGHEDAIEDFAPPEDIDRTAPSDRIKSPRCRDCAFDAGCQGIWRAYGERFGLDELTPLPPAAWRVRRWRLAWRRWRTLHLPRALLPLYRCRLRHHRLALAARLGWDRGG